MPVCCQCPSQLAAAAAEQLQQSTALSAEEEAAAAIQGPIAACFNQRERIRAQLLASGTRNPGLRPRRRTAFRKLDPCNPVVDPVTQALLDQFNGVTDGCQRVCKVPSVFRGVNARQAVENCYEMGFMNALPDEQSQSPTVGGIRTMGLGGGGDEKRFGQLCTMSRNLLQRPLTFCRQPSMFTCTTDRCQAALCLEMGITNVLPDQQHRDYAAGCTLGLGGGRGPGDKTFGDLRVRVTSFGNTDAGL